MGEYENKANDGKEGLPADICEQIEYMFNKRLGNHYTQKDVEIFVRTCGRLPIDNPTIRGKIGAYNA